MERIAALYGAPPSTIAAVWLGQALTQQENALGMVEKLASSVGGDLQALMRDAMAGYAGAFASDQGVPADSHELDITVGEFIQATKP